MVEFSVPATHGYGGRRVRCGRAGSGWLGWVKLHISSSTEDRDHVAGKGGEESSFPERLYGSRVTEDHWQQKGSVRWFIATSRDLYGTVTVPQLRVTSYSTSLLLPIDNFNLTSVLAAGQVRYISLVRVNYYCTYMPCHVLLLMSMLEVSMMKL